MLSRGAAVFLPRAPRIIFDGMSYPWQRVSADSLLDAVRKQPLNFDSWLLVTYDDPTQDPSQQSRSALWFSGPEEAALFFETKLVPMWVPASDTATSSGLLEHVRKLRASRKLRLKDLQAWSEAFNAISGRHGQIFWYGPFDDFQRGEGEAMDLATDLEFWLGENDIALAEVNPDEPRHQRLLVEFFTQLGA